MSLQGGLLSPTKMESAIGVAGPRPDSGSALTTHQNRARDCVQHRLVCYRESSRRVSSLADLAQLR
jgi:hypothetical protein